MKIETMKITSWNSKKLGISVILSKGNFYLEINLGKKTFIIGFVK